MAVAPLPLAVPAVTLTAAVVAAAVLLLLVFTGAADWPEATVSVLDCYLPDVKVSALRGRAGLHTNYRLFQIVFAGCVCCAISGPFGGVFALDPAVAGSFPCGVR